MPIFENLSAKLTAIAGRMRGKSRVTEQDIKDMMREIRMALLEADVNYQVVRDLVAEISGKCLGAEVMESLTPGQQVVKIVHESLIGMLGGATGKLAVSPSGFTVIMLYGLQGAGKTTAAAKIALMLKKRGKKPMVASVDVHRPAAARQLEILAAQVGVPCFSRPEERDAAAIASQAVDRARYMLCDTLIVDTAGRMTVDDDLMDELEDIGKAVRPTEKLLVVDAMIGQEAVGIALAFDKRIGLDGFVMTKLDGDARGGAALSIVRMTGKPIKLACIGEKVADIEEFHPDRMASRILGMGDVLTLIEKATEAVDEKRARQTMDNIMNNQFTMQDMLSQFEEVRKMGSIQDVLGMIPGMKGKKLDNAQVDPKAIDRSMAIIRAMTRKERINPGLLNASRRKRIAAGSGTTVQDVNRLVNQFEDTKSLMKRFTGMSKGRKRGRMGFPF
ncbi:MAG: signal recognition particle protein [Clostridia bacterium]|nr:signal recognition particle protein [Clostridia bacterium]